MGDIATNLPAEWRHAWPRHRGFVLAGWASLLAGVVLVGASAHWMQRRSPAPAVAISPPAATGEVDAGAAPSRPPVSLPSLPTPLPAGPPTISEPSGTEASGTEPSGTETSRVVPAWLRYAVAAPASGAKPMVALIIDDVGLDRARARQVIALPGPVTVSLMSYAADAQRQADDARAHGHELMMHVPMQPMGEHVDPGPDVLAESLPPAELQRRIEADLDRFTGYVGINNHMGSQFTQSPRGMAEVMAALNRRGLMFIDSLTIARSVGQRTAQEAGVPSAARDVFIDNDPSPAAVAKWLTLVEAIARRKGTVIAIGHPHDGTLAALNAWLPTLADKGLVLVPVTAVVKARQTDGEFISARSRP